MPNRKEKPGPEFYLNNPVEFTKKLLVALCFEQYLRFFFLDVEEESIDTDIDAPAILRVPKEIEVDIEKTKPSLLPLLHALQNKAITFEQSRSAVIDQTASLIGIEPHSHAFRQMAAEISVSELFQDELLEFHSWIAEMDETQDFTMPIPFVTWLAKYRQWRESV